MHIHVVARSQKAGEIFLERHRALDRSRITIHQDVTSYFQLLNHIIERSDNRVDCVVHDDVFLSEAFSDSVDTLLIELGKAWPNWGVCGNAGVLPFAVGASAASIVRYVFDPHGGPNFQGVILPAIGVDGHMLLLNTARLRERGVALPAFQGFQLYDVTLCLEALRSGLAVLVAPHLACYHASRGSQSGFDIAGKSSSYGEYLATVVRNRSVPTLNGSLAAPLTPSQTRGQLDVEMGSLRVAVKGRPIKDVAIVVRSQFQNPLMLRRAIESIAAFCAAAGESVRFTPVLVTDRPDLCPALIRRYAKVVSAEISDSANARTKFIESAVRAIDADYFWFVDESSWLFPNEAERIGLAVNSAPKESIFFMDAQYFGEELGEKGSVLGRGYRMEEGQRVVAAEWFKSLSGQKPLPLNSLICSRQTLLDIPAGIYSGAGCHEDFAVLLYALRSLKQVPIVVGKLLVGISKGEDDGNSMEATQIAWHQSAAEIASGICVDRTSPDLMAVMSMDRFASYKGAPMASGQSGAEVANAATKLSGAERLAIVQIRLVKGVLRFILTPSRWKARARLAKGVLGAEGVRGLLRYIALSGL